MWKNGLGLFGEAPLGPVIGVQKPRELMVLCEARLERQEQPGHSWPLAVGYMAEDLAIFFP